VYCKWALFPTVALEAHNRTAEQDLSRRRTLKTTPERTPPTQTTAPAPVQAKTPDATVPTNPANNIHPPHAVSSLSSPRPESPPALEQTPVDSPDCSAFQREPTPQTSRSLPSTTQDGTHPPSLQLPFTPPLSTSQCGNADEQGSPHVTPPPSPRLRLSGPVTTVVPVIDHTDRPTDELGPLVTNRGHVGRLPPHAGTFTFDDTSPFVTVAAINYLQTIPGGQRWVDMVTSYLRLEALPLVKGVCVNHSVRLPLILIRLH